LLDGKVTVYKSAKEVRCIEIKEGSQPVILGITALVSENRQHMSSVKADSDLKVERIYIDQLRGLLVNEIPKVIKDDIAVMIKSIVMGNEILSMVNKYCDIPRVSLEIPEELRPDIKEILMQIIRLYHLINEDVENIIKAG
jgi:hypothetical protein